MHKSPAKGAKFKLNKTRVRVVPVQSVSSLYCIVPNTKFVFISDLIPTTIIKPSKNAIKITPNEPILINMDKSFLLVIAISIGYIMKPQYA